MFGSLVLSLVLVSVGVTAQVKSICSIYVAFEDDDDAKMMIDDDINDGESPFTILVMSR